MIWRRDEDGIDIFAFQQTAVIHVAFTLADVFGASDSPLINIADGDDLDVLGFGLFDETADMARAHAADTDDADADAIVCAGGARVVQGTERDNPCRKGRAFDEVTPGDCGHFHGYF